MLQREAITGKISDDYRAQGVAKVFIIRSFGQSKEKHALKLCVW